MKTNQRVHPAWQVGDRGYGILLLEQQFRCEEQTLGLARRSQLNVWLAAAPSNGETALPFRTGGKQIGTILGQGLGCSLPASYLPKDMS